jgi:2,4-dienoyl-CoA reductase-like NADH-dependent reductase (Old Yellow Enzyme family)
MEYVSRYVLALLYDPDFYPDCHFCQDMGMKDPVPQFSHVVSRIRDLHPNLSYIHVVEARIEGSFERDAAAAAGQSNEFIRKIWDSRPLVFAGGYAREDAIDAADNKNVLVAFGRHFIANVSFVFISIISRILTPVLLSLICR